MLHCQISPTVQNLPRHMPYSHTSHVLTIVKCSQSAGLVHNNITYKLDMYVLQNEHVIHVALKYFVHAFITMYCGLAVCIVEATLPVH